MGISQSLSDLYEDRRYISRNWSPHLSYCKKVVTAEYSHTRFEMGAESFNAAGHVVELFGIGYLASEENWCGIFEDPTTDDFSILVQPQNFVAWLPTCFTTRWDIGIYGEVASSFSDLMFDGPSDAEAKLAVIVGSINGGVYYGHEMMAEYLVEARRQAIPGETTIAEIAYQAVIECLENHPEERDHALGLQTLGR